MKSQGNSTSKVTIPSPTQPVVHHGGTSLRSPKGVTSGKK